MNFQAWILSAVLVMTIGGAGCAVLTQDTDFPASASRQSPTDLYNKAVALYQDGRYAQAKEAFHQFIGQYPDSKLFFIALYYLGHCYQMTGDDKEALVFYNRVVTTLGDDDFWGAQAMKRIRQIKGDHGSGQEE